MPDEKGRNLGDFPAGKSPRPAWAASVDSCPRQVRTKQRIQACSEQTPPSSSGCGPRRTVRTPSFIRGGQILNLSKPQLPQRGPFYGMNCPALETHFPQKAMDPRILRSTRQPSGQALCHQIMNWLNSTSGLYPSTFFSVFCLLHE